MSWTQDICSFCMACIRPCLTGAIDHWPMVAQTYTVGEQLSWRRLPTVEPTSPHRAPNSLFTRDSPAVATVASTQRVTQEPEESEVRLILLDFGACQFPFLEGQSIDVVPPGERADGRTRAMRLYSIACARDGEQTGTNTMALFVKRVAEPRADGTVFRGVASNWLCDLRPGDRIEVVGPFGETFLMPDDPEAELLLIGTGTGRASFRGFAQRRLRTAPHARGQLHLFFGTRTPQVFPTLEPLRLNPHLLRDRELVYSRTSGWDREHVQDRMRQKAGVLAQVLRHDRLHVFVCGSRGLEQGVNDTLTQIGQQHGVDWPVLRRALNAAGRYHVETYQIAVTSFGWRG